MRLAWFSPLPPVRSGVAAYSADVVPYLRRAHVVDCFVDGHGAAADACDAHDFLWRHRRQPYDLVVYQLGNAPCHDYMWAYLAAHPGLVVLHDGRLHQARARSLLRRNRAEEYRAEFLFDHPDAPAGVEEYAVEGLGGSIYYFWSMLRVVMVTARTIASHNPRVAAALRQEYPAVPVETIRMGVAGSDPPRDGEARARIRRELAIPDAAVVFVVFGKMTAEKRIGVILRALRTLADEGLEPHLLVVGDASEDRMLERTLGETDRVRTIGYVEDAAVEGYLAAADVCLSLRWPTALETSASWLRGLASRRATVISDLPHIVDVPAVDPRTWRTDGPTGEAAAVRIDLLDEERSLVMAMRRLAVDAPLRESLARAGHARWARDHTLEVMAADYARVIEASAARQAPTPATLPAHFTSDHSAAARLVAARFGVDVDILRSG